VEGARLQQSGAADLDVAIINHTDAGGRTIFALPKPAVGSLKSGPSDLVLVSAHDVGDQRWSIIVSPGQSWQLPSTGIDPWSVLVVGLLLTALMLQYLITAWERTRVIEKAVTARTAELCVVNGTLAQEISERKQAELDLRAAKEKVEIASRAKSEFLAMMGHELRTPLNAVIGFADILTNETFGPLGEARYRDYAIDIGRSGNDLLQIINDILDLTKIETGEFDMPEESLDIAKLVANVCSAASEKAHQAGLSLEIKAEQNTPPLKGSSQAIKRVLEVLLSNALKFTPHDGQVTVTCGRDGTGGIVIEVSDNGIGIAPQDQERVFQPFTQVDQTLSRSHQGTGLGLTLAQRLMELHGGALKLESQLGDGTKIRALFPAKRSLPPEKTQKAEKPKTPRKANASGKAA
jgi:signal transduction histidine kinase